MEWIRCDGVLFTDPPVVFPMEFRWLPQRPQDLVVGARNKRRHGHTANAKVTILGASLFLSALETEAAANGR